VITVAGAALLARTHKGAVYSGVKSGSLSCVQFGRKMMFEPAAVRKWIDGVNLARDIHWAERERIAKENYLKRLREWGEHRDEAAA